jgi:hypothetical protein
MTVNEVLAYRENQVNQQAYEQRLAEEARKKLEKPVDNLPKKTGFELDLRQDGKKYWVVMTNHHTEVVHDIKLTVHYLIGNVRYEVLRLTIPTWAPDEQRTSDKWEEANPNIDSIEVFGEGENPLLQRVEIKMRWRPGTGHGP